MKKIVILAIITLLGTQTEIFSQGCVAIRSNGNTCTLGKPEEAKGWQLNLNNRYFRSYKHFVGTEEQKERTEQHTQVINHSYSMDATLTRYIDSRWSVAVTLPFISNSRSSLYEHGGNSAGQAGRHSTQSIGIGDIRVTGYRWLLDPATNHKGNIQVGLGIKFATGNYRVDDYFFKNDSTTLLGPVDQSIQLGDGGTGLITEISGYYNFNHTIGAYGNAYYLINPQEQNGVSTGRGAPVNATAIKYFTGTMSVPDQYMARVGLNIMANRFNFSGGLRLEGIPSSDLVGGDKGFRRPGYVVSAEPVISYTVHKINYYVSVPVAVKRDRTQSYSDKLRSEDTKAKVQGDAAFADYLVNVGISVRL